MSKTKDAAVWLCCLNCNRGKPWASRLLRWAMGSPGITGAELRKRYHP